MPALFKHQRFNNSESEKTAPIVYKHQRFDECDNEKGQSLDKDKNDGDGDRYIFLSPTAFSPPSQKESNRPSDLDEETRSLTHLVYIPKNC